MKKLLISLILPLSALANAGSYTAATERVETCRAIADVAVSAANAKNLAGQTWEDFLESTKDIPAGNIREVMLQVTKQAYDTDPNMPLRTLWSFSYSRCMDSIKVRG